MIRTNLPQPRAQRFDQQGRREAERFVGAVDVGDREGDRQQHDPADQRRVEDRPPHTLRRRFGGAVGLLGDVGRGVEAGDRVLGQQEAERQHVEPVHPVAEAAVVDPVAEDEAEALVAVGDDDQDDDDRGDADHVPPDRDAVDQREQVRAADVDRGVESEDQREEEEDLAEDVRFVAEVDPEDVHFVEAEDDVEEGGAGVVDRGDHGDQADQVEPAGEPGPDRAAEPSRPPVDAAGSRVGGDQLRHAEADDQDRDRDQRPADRDRDRAAVVPGLTVGGEAAGQDRDDRERDREVGEPAPSAVQRLFVAEFRESLFVAAGGRNVALHATLSLPEPSQAPD